MPERRRVERLAVRGVDAVRHDEKICRPLVELLVAFEVQRVRCRLPHDLVDPDDLEAGPDEKDVELVAVERSIGPENGTEIRGWMLNPSSVLSTSISAQSDGRTAQSGFARSTRRPVACVASSDV